MKSKSDGNQRNALSENVLHMGAGFAAKEHPHVLAALSSLGSRLGRHRQVVDLVVLPGLASPP